MLLQLFLILLLSTTFLPSSTGQISRPGCPDRCGPLSIPFPFGVGPGCSKERSFDVNCNATYDPPKPFLSMYGAEILGINPTNVRLNYPNLALSSFGARESRIGTVSYTLSSTRYSFSDENWLTAIGCDDMAAVTGQANRSFSGGCLAYCRSTGDSNGVASCPDDSNMFGLGTGCCRAPIPKGTTNLYVNLTDVHRTWRTNKLFSTSYAFVGEKVTSNFTYRLNDLNNSTMFLTNNWAARNTPPVIFDWKIGAESCVEATRNPTTYACQGNTDCVDFDTNVAGYLCNCSKGYQGNPYLAPGCQDINECADSETSPCDANADCANTPGSFSCKCRERYGGDGLKDGNGCTRQPPSTIINISIGLGAGVGFILLLAMGFFLRKTMQKRKKRLDKEKFFEHLLLQHQTNEGTLERTKLFPAKELEKATDNFNQSRILGQGGQGTVYKGMLSDGKIVAIKKLKLVDEDQLEQLINEVVILSQINHRNVVRLLGCCLATEVPLLVYEFVSHGTLFDLIHGRNAEISLSWNMRLKMAADIAGALAYLHSASSVPIFHRDVKSSNILLDEKYVVKVSDFGTSKVVAVDQTHLTTLVKGTFGYLDPEYFQTSQFTDKSDVYSFGVVLAELLTGRRPISTDMTEGDRNLASRFLASMGASNLDTILEARVAEEGGREEVFAVARIAERCLNHKGKMRPSMREVATELESIRISQMPSTVRDEGEEISHYEVKPMMISDIDYTWASGKSEISSTSDTRPFISDDLV